MRRIILITRLDKPFSREESLGSLNIFIRKWFEGKYKELTPPQKYALKLINDRKNVLITAPTGSGKTFSAFTSILSDLMNMSFQGKLEEKVYCVYVSPLRALNNDIYRNLTKPLEEIFSKISIPIQRISVGIRTGDTTVKERQQQLRKPPNILVTTPESLAILINSEKFSQNMKDVRYVIIDEMHELANNKRGVHLSMSIERLADLIGHDFVRIGLGATLSPLDDAAKFLVGYRDGKERDCFIIDATWNKQLEFGVMCPVRDIINAPDAKIEESIYKTIDKIIKENRTTLVFTNTRSGTERVVYNLIKRYGYGEDIAAHHGSLSREARLGVEDMLKKGNLKCAVSSTSLELGIDIGTIDNVVQIGSPKSVSRAVQRFGRSGHSFNDIARGEVIVTNRDDLIECSVMLDAAKKRRLDTFTTPMNALDVLAQHIVGMSHNKDWNVEGMYSVIRSAYPYHTLPKEDLVSLLKYLSGAYVGLESRRVYGKILYDEKSCTIKRRGTYSKVIYYLNLGTIPDEVSIDVVTGGNKWMGSIQEEFLSRLKPGDVFVLGGKPYRFEYSRIMKCYVTDAPGQVPTIPPWVSEQLPLTYELAMEIGKFREDFAAEVRKTLENKKSAAYRNIFAQKDWSKSMLNDMPMDNNSRNSAFNYFSEQILFADYVPNHKAVLIEKTYDDEGKRNLVIFHTLYGRRINDALSRIFAIRIADTYGVDIGVRISDNGFVLVTESEFELKKKDIDSLIEGLKGVNTEELLKLNIRRTEMMKRRFRYCAARSFMILRNYMGFKISVKKQHVSAQMLLKAVEEIDPNFPILKETYREILEDVMDLPRTNQIIGKMLSKEIGYRIIENDIPSPFSHMMMTFGEADIIMMKDRRRHIRELHKQVLERIRKMKK